VSARRGSSNANVRGNSKDRAARRRYLLHAFQSDRGPGTCRCYRCGDVLTERTVTVDRIIHGCNGGRYTRNNIRPACSRCNSETGGRLAHG
jgi:5-methylcytosine-specific restriction endonuclease McrA